MTAWSAACPAPAAPHASIALRGDGHGRTPGTIRIKGTAPARGTRDIACLAVLMDGFPARQDDGQASALTPHDPCGADSCSRHGAGAGMAWNWSGRRSSGDFIDGAFRSTASTPWRPGSSMSRTWQAWRTRTAVRPSPCACPTVRPRRPRLRTRSLHAASVTSLRNGTRATRKGECVTGSGLPGVRRAHHEACTSTTRRSRGLNWHFIACISHVSPRHG